MAAPVYVSVGSRIDVQTLVASGRGYGVNRGTATTPISFAKTAYDEDQPALTIDVPEDSIIVPVLLEVVLEDAAGTDNAVVWGVSNNLAGAGTSSALTSVNLRADQPTTSDCTVRRDYTGNATAATNLLEIVRDGDAFANVSTGPSRRAFRHTIDTMVMPTILGEASLYLWVWATTTAPSGFVTVHWVELLR